MPNPKFIVVLEGELIQCVVSHDPNFVGKEFLVVDYDTDGADESELRPICQGDGTISDAIVWGDNVNQAEIRVPENA